MLYCIHFSTLTFLITLIITDTNGNRDNLRNQEGKIDL